MRYQNAMIEHFRRTGARNPKSAFDSWRTSLANEAARKQAGFRPGNFASSRPRR